MVSLKRISTAIGLLAAAAAPALAQGNAPNRNQSTADRVAAALSSGMSLTGSRIEIDAREGLVTLSGTVAHPAVRAQAIARAQRVPGVISVADRLRVVGDSRVQAAQYQPQPTQVAMGGGGLFHHNRGGYVDGGMMGGEPVMDGGMVDSGPIPEGAAGAGGTQASMPRSPNYAWPSYAPYPNFSAVGYPTAYPWQAWPNIGPFYPYPEVPLDWRAVTLRWDDGIWWLDFRKHYTRPFFTPYPFGIFGY
jgi:hypothetical protein